MMTLEPGAHVRIKVDAPLESVKARGKTAVFKKYAPTGHGAYAMLMLDERVDGFRFWLVHPESLEIVQ